RPLATRGRGNRLRCLTPDWWIHMAFSEWWHDLRIAWRGLCRAPGFTAAAVIVLALGIAGTTTMYALIEGVLLRPLPVRAQAWLVLAWQELRSARLQHYPFRVRDLDVVRRASATLEAVAGVGYNGALPAVAIERGSASYIDAVAVTGGFFGVVGVEPV